MSSPSPPRTRLLLGRRLTLVVVGIAIVLASGYLIMGVWFAKVQLEDEFLENSEVVAASLASSMIEAMLTHNIHEIPDLLDNAQAVNPNLKYVFVTNSKGEPVAYTKTFENGVPRDLVQIAREHARDHSGNRTWDLRTDQGDILHLVYHLEGRPGGFLHMGFSLAQVDHKLRITFRHLVSSMLLGLMVSAAVGGIVYRRMAQPITELTSAAADFGAGDLSRRAAVKEQSEDEVTLLAQAFNRMAGQLEEKLNELTRSQSELAYEKTRIQAILDGMMHGVIFYEPDGRVGYLNSTAREHWGLEAGITPSSHQEVHQGRQAAARAFECVALGMTPDRLVRERNGERVLDVFLSTLSDERDGLLGLIELSVDMTDQEAQARALAHAEKLNVVGQLASGVAHEINSPLDGAIEAARIIGGGDLEPEEIKNFARAQQSALERIAAIVRRLLTFSRREHTTRERVRAMDVIGEAAELVRHRLSRGKLELVLSPLQEAPYYIHCEALELSQVVVNLISNAIDASPVGGVIRIEVSGRDGWVEIVVSDQGPGVPDRARERIFTPFFTTKEVGKGTGLGLAISKNIVENYGGRIDFENGPPPWGASFRVRIPGADEASPDREAEPIEDAHP